MNLLKTYKKILKKVKKHCKIYSNLQNNVYFQQKYNYYNRGE